MVPKVQLCSYKSVKVLQIHSVWIGTLKNTFLVIICIYIGELGESQSQAPWPQSSLSTSALSGLLHFLLFGQTGLQGSLDGPSFSCYRFLVLATFSSSSFTTPQSYLFYQAQLDTWLLNTVLAPEDAGLEYTWMHCISVF